MEIILRMLILVSPKASSLETDQFGSALFADLRRSEERVVVQIVQVVLLIEAVAFHRRIVFVFVVRIVLVLLVVAGLHFVFLLLLFILLAVRLDVIILKDLVAWQESAQIGELLDIDRYQREQLTGLFVWKQTVIFALAARSGHETCERSFQVSFLATRLLSNCLILGDRLLVCIGSNVGVCIWS